MLINNWYVLALSEELGDEPLGVHALRRDLVLYRDADGVARCLVDTCVHKGGSLCRGLVEGGAVQCPYHGWRFDGAGQCVEIPSLGPEQNIPKRARVDAYPTAEKWGWIWAFLGDLGESERPTLPDFFPELDEGTEDWRFNRGKAQFQCNWVRAVENGVDRSHAVFVHTDFGNPERKQVADYEVIDDGNSLYVRGTSKPLDKRGQWRDAIPDKRTDRENEVRIYLRAPCIRIQMHMQPPKSQVIVTAYTPVEDGITQLHFIQARNFLTEEKYDQDSLERVYFVLKEDADVLNHLKPVRVPSTMADELLLENDKHGTLFRQRVQDLEARGWALDERAMSEETDRIRAIPCPARREDPQGWVHKPVLMR
jgi:phenylpropionate dioxygenase-like ring-hydroxylating dioxygenase large terminal subunit